MSGMGGGTPVILNPCVGCDPCPIGGETFDAGKAPDGGEVFKGGEASDGLCLSLQWRGFRRTKRDSSSGRRTSCKPCPESWTSCSSR